MHFLKLLPLAVIHPFILGNEKGVNVLMGVDVHRFISSQNDELQTPFKKNRGMSNSNVKCQMSNALFSLGLSQIFQENLQTSFHRQEQSTVLSRHVLQSIY